MDLRGKAAGVMFQNMGSRPLWGAVTNGGGKGIFRVDPCCTMVQECLREMQAPGARISTEAVRGKSAPSGQRSDLLFRFGSFQNENGATGGAGTGVGRHPIHPIPIMFFVSESGEVILGRQQKTKSFHCEGVFDG